MLAVKQLVSRSFHKHGVSAVAMAAHKFFFSKIKINLYCTRFIKLAVVPKRGSESEMETGRVDRHRSGHRSG